MQQLITPNPNIACQPGWCLQYVRQTFGLPARYASATEAWEQSGSQHADRDFPDGVWHPVWYGLANEPAGHVVLRAPDGSVFSTSDLGSTPHHHPNLADLEWYYAHYGMPLTYRGWTEDVAGYQVIGGDGSAAIAPQGTITTEEETMAIASQEWLDSMIAAQSRMDQRSLDIYNRVFGREVQRYYNPETNEVRTEEFPGSVSARSSDVHDVITTNGLINSQTSRILDAIAGIPGVDAAVISGLRDELAAELKEATANLSVTLTVAPSTEPVLKPGA